MNQEKPQNNRIPDYDPSKPMDSRREVAQSNDEKIDQDFTGYPHAPAREDKMHEETGDHNRDEQVEKMAARPNRSGVSERFDSSDEDVEQRNRHERSVQESGEKKDAGENRNAETGVPQNVTNEDLKKQGSLPGTDVEKAAQS